MNSASKPTLANSHHATGLVHTLGTLWQNCGLIRQMIKREVLIWNRVPNPYGLGLYLLEGFADVL